jgi:hypothetical protein
VAKAGNGGGRGRTGAPAGLPRAVSEAARRRRRVTPVSGDTEAAPPPSPPETHESGEGSPKPTPTNDGFNMVFAESSRPEAHEIIEEARRRQVAPLMSAQSEVAAGATGPTAGTASSPTETPGRTHMVSVDARMGMEMLSTAKADAHEPAEILGSADTPLPGRRRPTFDPGGSFEPPFPRPDPATVALGGVVSMAANATVARGQMPAEERDALLRRLSELEAAFQRILPLAEAI